MLVGAGAHHAHCSFLNYNDEFNFSVVDDIRVSPRL